MSEINLTTAYFEKQRKFVSLIKDVQISLTSKEYKKQGYTFNEFIKIKWNISQAQAYRYLLCAKVLDQLEEFEIKPSYERLCKALSKVAKTPIQMKLLWSAILKKTGGRPDCVNSTHVNNIWKELCKNEKYSNFCHYEGDIMTKIEKSLNKYENEKKHKLINSTTENKNNKQVSSNNVMSKKTELPSPSSSGQNSESLSNSTNVDQSIISNNNGSNSNIPLSPLSDCNESQLCNASQYVISPIPTVQSIQSIPPASNVLPASTIPQIPSMIPASSIPQVSSMLPASSIPQISSIIPASSVIPTTIPNSENIYYVPYPNELPYQQPINYIQDQSQNYYYYY
eukprot:jgi/Orpsp1_1/1178394/evm.model.c7180000065108.1